MRPAAELDLAAIEELFEQARQLDEDDRRRLLDSSTVSPAVIERVERLLRAEAKAGQFLQRSALEDLVDDGEILTPGTNLCGLELVRQLGKGGSGAVWLAIQRGPHFERLVAVKYLRRRADSELSEEQFGNEARILAGLDHPHIVRLFDSGVTPSGTPFLVMEHVEGLTLLDFCRQQELAITARLELLTQVCGAVDYAHRQSVIHRDLKPANILVTRDGEVKLLDFGIARWLRPAAAPGALAETMPWQLRLTPSYASPEQLRGERLGPATDVYSIGVLLHELICGHRPFEAVTDPADSTHESTSPDGAEIDIAEVEIDVVERSLKSSSLTGRQQAAVAGFVGRCLAENPAHRPASVTSLSDILKASPAEPSTEIAGLTRYRTVMVPLLLCLGVAFWLGMRWSTSPAHQFPEPEAQRVGSYSEPLPVSKPGAEQPEQALEHCRTKSRPSPDGGENLRAILRCLVFAEQSETARSWLMGKYAGLDDTTQSSERTRLLQALVKFHQMVGEAEAADAFAAELRQWKSTVGSRGRQGTNSN